MDRKFIIFDLDGTLIDTNLGIKEALNQTLKELNINKEYTLEEVTSFIGNGARVLFFKALNREFKESEYELFLSNYEKYQYISPLYKNVYETLLKLKEEGYFLFVYSNKPDKILRLLVDNKFKEKDLFTYVQGQSENFKRKPDPEFINYLIDKYDLDINKGIYVGDSIVDITLANNAKLKSIILSYGYGIDKKELKEKATYYIDEFKEILNILKKE